MSQRERKLYINLAWRLDDKFFGSIFCWIMRVIYAIVAYAWFAVVGSDGVPLTKKYRVVQVK